MRKDLVWVQKYFGFMFEKILSLHLGITQMYSKSFKQWYIVVSWNFLYDALYPVPCIIPSLMYANYEGVLLSEYNCKLAMLQHNNIWQTDVNKILYTSNHSRWKTFAVHQQSIICRENFCGWELNTRWYCVVSGQHWYSRKILNGKTFAVSKNLRKL